MKRLPEEFNLGEQSPLHRPPHTQSDETARARCLLESPALDKSSPDRGWIMLEVRGIVLGECLLPKWQMITLGKEGKESPI